jgi:hypothetical protein
MNQNFSQFEKEFGKFGSWAIWNTDPGNPPLIDKDNLNPKVIFVGFNASKDLEERPDWSNFHFGSPYYMKLAEVLAEDEFSYFKDGYMTDIIKTEINAKSDEVDKILRKDRKETGNKIKENKDIFERELKLFLEIFGNKKYPLICMGDSAFYWTKKMVDGDIYQITHYSVWGWEKVKEKIRQDLGEVLKKIKE